MSNQPLLSHQNVEKSVPCNRCTWWVTAAPRRYLASGTELFKLFGRVITIGDLAEFIGLTGAEDNINLTTIKCNTCDHYMVQGHKEGQPNGK